MSFNLHVQTVAHLLRASSATDKANTNFQRFAAYIIWNHAHKLVQRIISADLPEEFIELCRAVGQDKASLTGSQAAKTLDLMVAVDKAFLADRMEKYSGRKTLKFGSLLAFVKGEANGKSHPQSILYAFHRFFFFGHSSTEPLST
jgi:hypothetical protein